MKKYTMQTIGGGAAALVLALSVMGHPLEVLSADVTGESNTLEAQADYSYYASPKIGKSGALYLTDNHTVTDLMATSVKTARLSFSVPDTWLGSVVVRSRYIDQSANEELYKNPIRDSYVIRFYEADTWKKYRTDEYKSRPNATSMGEVLEIRIMNGTENDLSTWSEDPLYIHAATLTGDDGTYEVYVKHPKRNEGLVDEEFADAYAALSEVDFRSIVISSMSSTSPDLQFDWASLYVRTHYVDEYLARIQNSETMEDGADSGVEGGDAQLSEGDTPETEQTGAADTTGEAAQQTGGEADGA